jgi:hypothetical protein
MLIKTTNEAIHGQSVVIAELPPVHFDDKGHANVSTEQAALFLTLPEQFSVVTEADLAVLAEYRERVRVAAETPYDAGRTVMVHSPLHVGQRVTMPDNHILEFDSAGVAVCGERTAELLQGVYPDQVTITPLKPLDTAPVTEGREDDDNGDTRDVEGGAAGGDNDGGG